MHQAVLLCQLLPWAQQIRGCGPVSQGGGGRGVQCKGPAVPRVCAGVEGTPVAHGSFQHSLSAVLKVVCSRQPEEDSAEDGGKPSTRLFLPDKFPLQTHSNMSFILYKWNLHIIAFLKNLIKPKHPSKIHTWSLVLCISIEEVSLAFRSESGKGHSWFCLLLANSR